MKIFTQLYIVLTLLLLPVKFAGAGSLDEIQIDQPKTNRIVIIIDDIGDNYLLGERAVSLPGKVTMAFLPHTPNAESLAHQAHKQGKEIMLHMPMSNINDRALGPGGLTPDMDDQLYRTTLVAAIEAIPHVRGINNHMGSELTQLPKQMEWLMSEIACRELFFVDSKTSPKSVAYASASHADLPRLKRDIFLDHSRNPEDIAAAFDKLIRISEQHGLAVGIGHPYPETLAYLESAIPKLNNIELIFPSEILTPFRQLRRPDDAGMQLSQR